MAAPGSVAEFQIKCGTDPGSIATVSLSSTQTTFASATDPPVWNVTFPGRPKSKGIVWLGMLGWDRQIWWVKMHSQGDGVGIKVWYEVRGPHAAPVPNDDPSQLRELTLDDNTQLGYLNPSDERWIATVQHLGTSGGHPLFLLSRA
jgi:hypothetical protein